MKFLNSAELTKKIYEDYIGIQFIGYKFKINNSPTIRVTKGAKKLLSCTCKLHSIHSLKDKKCRFTEAFELWKEWNKSSNQQN